MPNLKNLRKALVSVPNRSGFDKSYRNMFTAKCGSLIPIMTDEVIPGSKVHLNLALAAELPPLASESYMNVKYKVEAFFVPTRLLMPSYEKWLFGEEEVRGDFAFQRRAPIVQFTPNQVKPGSLMDYLGFMVFGSDGQMTTKSVASAFPLLAYHLIYDDWYRNSVVQKSLFYDEAEAIVNGVNNGYIGANMKWYIPRQADNNYILTGSTGFANGDSIYTIHQRNFGSDFFTVATPSPQAGNEQKIQIAMPDSIRVDSGSYLNDFAVDSDNQASFDSGTLKVNPNLPMEASFSISALRAANSMQLFLERNALCGPRLVDFVKAQFGANLKDSIAQRPVYLGSASFDVYTKGIYQSNPENSNDVASNNPFNSVGARFGHGYAEGSAGSLIDFEVEEPGYVMVIGSLVPEAAYGTGINRYLMRYTMPGSQTDMAFPLLQNVGNEPIVGKELAPDCVFWPASVESGIDEHVFGYSQRYASWMTRQNEIHGLLRDGGSLASFALQRSFVLTDDSGVDDPAYQISSKFLEIPTSYLDQVAAVADTISDYGVWVDCYFDYKVSMPLYEYSIPSLQDPAIEHGYSFLIDRGGRRLE